jgi:hypothetical protein
MNIIFIFACIIHILIWTFVLLAFLNKNTAWYNLYYIIPFIYLIHTILPGHVLNEIKKNIYPNSWETKAAVVGDTLIIPRIFSKVRFNLNKYCFQNPLSPQGMLILGSITSLYSLYPPW